MAPQEGSILTNILREHQQEILDQWMTEQVSASGARGDLISEAELRKQSSEFLTSFREAVARGELHDIATEAWVGAREVLGSLSRNNAIRGFTPAETATFVLSLKNPIFSQVTTAAGGDAEKLSEGLRTTNHLLDSLALFTTDIFQRSREDVISRQQQELLELSTPVVKLWDGILAVPLIGTLDSARTQVVMESLLQRIVETGAGVAIIDITGVPMVDTLVAQHLIKTVAAARLMGAECIISGIRPQIAQTIVHLGVELVGAVTKATLADAILYALRQTGWTVTRGRA